jgi:hypothetical protein
MKIQKTMPVFVSAISLLGAVYAYACNLTVTDTCVEPNSWSVSCPNNEGGGAHGGVSQYILSAGQDVNSCEPVHSGGSSDCSTPAPVPCTFTSVIIYCDGTISTGSGSVPTTTESAEGENC